MENNLKWIFLVLYLVSSSNGARILGIFPTPSSSHQVPFQTIMRALAARGHQVTIITPDPLKVGSTVLVTDTQLQS
ncbi:hypothetical protein C0J52_28242 [Blattella germanica]|nr:hypothetical protein C0J52_28242 [Blattella germanica]